MNASRLKELREERGETRRDVAMATGLTENTILALEGNGKTNPRLSTIMALASHYGVPIEEIVGGPEG